MHESIELIEIIVIMLHILNEFKGKRNFKHWARIITATILWTSFLVEEFMGYGTALTPIVIVCWFITALNAVRMLENEQ